jgi:hypothetical protein
VELPDAAVELPVRVSVQAIVPEAFTVGALHVAVKPWGSPDSKRMLAPVTPRTGVFRSGERMPLGGPVNWLASESGALADTAIPPTGVAVTVTVAVDRESTESAEGDTASWIPGACCTCNVTVWLEVSPSPAAVITSCVAATAAELAAVSVRVA